MGGSKSFLSSLFPYIQHLTCAGLLAMCDDVHDDSTCRPRDSNVHAKDLVVVVADVVGGDR